MRRWDATVGRIIARDSKAVYIPVVDDIDTHLGDETRQERRPFLQHRLVRLVRDFDAPDARIPSGTVATVLEIFKGGVAYLVEFEGPHEAPETVMADMLEAYDGPA